MDAKTAWSLASPFIAGFIASWVTYFFGVRGKRYDLVQAERLAAFRVLKERLLSLARYARARAANIDGGDLEPRTSDLAEGEGPNSFLMFHAEIGRVIDDYAHVVRGDAREALNELMARLQLVCHMQVAITGDPEDRSEATADMYRSTASLATKCVDRVYSGLQLPR